MTILDASNRRAIRYRCDCGNEGTTVADSLIAGSSRSCGCLKTELWLEARTKHSRSFKTYQYRLWGNIRGKCYSPKHKDYAYYGGRGIKMWEPWRKDYARFADDLDAALGPRPEGMTLDRINNDGDYEPGNLRWATREQQSNNRRARRWHKRPD